MKDIFNGNIKKDYIGYVKFLTIFLSVLWMACGVAFAIIPRISEGFSADVKSLLSVMSAIAFGCSVGYPALTIFLIRTYPKHKKLAKSLFNDNVFEDKE